jgi:hypothetical protein
MSTSINRTVNHTNWIDVATTGFVTLSARNTRNGVEWVVTTDSGGPVPPSSDFLGAFLRNDGTVNLDLDANERLYVRSVSGDGIVVVQGDVTIAGA